MGNFAENNLRNDNSELRVEYRHVSTLSQILGSVRMQSDSFLQPPQNEFRSKLVGIDCSYFSVAFQIIFKFDRNGREQNDARLLSFS